MNLSGLRSSGLRIGVLLLSCVVGAAAVGAELAVLDVTPPSISTDSAVTWDYPIVYVRASRFGDDKQTQWAEVFDPVKMDPGADLVLLYPDGREEVLVDCEKGSVADPYVSFDGKWIYFSKFHDLVDRGGRVPKHGSDIYKIHVETREVVRLTHQEFTLNTGAWPEGKKPPYGVINLGPCPLPGGKVMFTSNRNGYRPPKNYTAPCLQLFVMDDDGSNVEMIGHLNIGSALHPTILRDGRVMFSSYESQGLRDQRNWGLWSIHPDGTNWGPMVSSFAGELVIHFQTQLSDGSIVAEEYYNLNNAGFGIFFKFPPTPEKGYAAFGSADDNDPRNQKILGRHSYLRAKPLRFTPYGAETLTHFARSFDSPAHLSNPADKDSPRVGKVTHPSGAPDNHLLLVWSPGPVSHLHGLRKPALDAGIYLLKDGQPVREPGEMLLIKNDPKYNEQWPRAVVPYERIYGIKEPARLVHKNDGTKSKALPEGTPYGLVGTSSLYKRESFPGGAVPNGKVTAVFDGEDKTGYRGVEKFFGYHSNWRIQGSDAGLYANDEIHAIRILAMEPTSDRERKFRNHAMERLRILGEMPVRKFDENNEQPLDPDGNPDTSFLAKIPADTAFTFQMLDKDGLVLTMAQTWHQLRPGEIRHDCGGCHAHSQQPTDFSLTAAAKPGYRIWDVATETPLLTDKKHDQSKRRWDKANETGVRVVDQSVVNVEYHRHIKPILQRSCAACHTSKNGKKPAAGLDLDADDQLVDNQFPGTFYRLAWESQIDFHSVGWKKLQFGPKPISRSGHWGFYNASRYIRKFQSRRSLLAWKLLGRRTDGFSNDDFPTDVEPGDFSKVRWRGDLIETAALPSREQENLRQIADLDFTGSIMPPPEAVKKGKVAPLTDDDRRTIFRWIDLGCPIDLDFDPAQPSRTGYGWMCDENRPIVAITSPSAGDNDEVARILIGLEDYHTGLDMDRFHVSADFEVDGTQAGENLAERFTELPGNRWELKLGKPLDAGTWMLVVSIADRQGNVHRVERRFRIH